MCISQQATNIFWWGRIFHGSDFDALTGAKYSQWGRIFHVNISPGAKYTQQGGDKYGGGDSNSRGGNLAKSGQFIGQFLLVTGDPIGVKGLINIVLLIIILCCYLYVVWS